MFDTKDEMQMNELTRYWRDEKYSFLWLQLPKLTKARVESAYLKKRILQ